jgi:hypothetical protein
VTAANTVTLVGTDGATLDVGAGGAATFRSGTPSAGQAAEFLNPTTVQGVNVTGTGSAVKAGSPVLTGSPTLGTPSATSLGLGQTAPATAGMYAATAGANNINMFVLKRATDSSPTAAFEIFQSATGSPLWQVDITGMLSAGNVPSKRLTRVATTVTTGNSLPCNVDLSDICTTINTEVPGNLSIGAPTGTLTDNLPLRYRVKCSNTMTYIWHAVFRFSTDIPQPSSCTPGGIDYFGVLYNLQDARWDLVGAAQNVSG